MRFLLYQNPTREESRALAQTLQAHLTALGQEVCSPDAPESADMVVVLGGDGTLLHAVRTWYILQKPFWLVNCGRLGYLSDCEKENVDLALEKILRGDYRLDMRTQIGGVFADGRQVTALNEMLFHRGACVHALRIEVWVNDNLALNYRGDGLIVSTASGSTAYNLSAGGPVLMPEMELLALTPICAQTLSVGSMVISAHDAVSVSWRMGYREGMDEWPDLTCDGQQKFRLPLEGKLDVQPLPRIALVRTQDADFYGRLQHRMHLNADV